MKISILLMACAITVTAHHANAQWAFNGTSIFNANAGNVQITQDLEMLGNNDGTYTLGAIRWAGEAITSKRTAGGNQWGLDFYTAFANRMSITNGGNVGIGTTDPLSFKVKIVHGDYGFDLASSSGHDWEHVVFDDGLYLYANGFYVGHFDEASGQYFYTSDKRLKTDIKPMPSVLEKINQLKPSTYRFKNASGAPESIGFIAQDVAKLFPSLVQHNVNSKRGLDVYSLNYNGFSVIAIRAIQELQQKLQEQNQQIEAQNQKIEKLNELVNKLLNVQNEKSSSDAFSKGTADIILNKTTLEAYPNPAQNSTSIRYNNIPSGFKNAKVVITNNSGATLKLIQLSSNSGSININTSGLLNGTYDCSLIVDGNIILSKKIMVAK